MTQRHLFALAIAAFAIAACKSEPVDPTATAETELASSDALLGPTPTSLWEKFDCVRDNGALVSAHRGGPRGAYPENALETLQRTLDAATPILEIDVAETKDGVLFLLHDTNLERTTNGEGVARDLTWEEISQLKLTNRDGVTAFSPPSLKAVLDWAVANNAVVQLDKKRSTSFAKIIDAVRARKAAENVILITYTYDQAEEIAQIAPDLMMTATVEDPSDLDELAQRGVDLTRLIAWTGTRAPNPGLWEDVRARGVEIAFGTLGRRGERLDDQYWADRDGSEYNELVDQGVHLVATDYSDRVADIMVGDNRALRVCGFAR